METENTNELLKVLNKYAVPDPKIVGKLPKGGSSLSYVGHADITRILIEIDPHWRLVPIAWDNGRPAMNVVNDMATMWFELTLLGTARLAIGSAKSNAPDLDKVLYGDALRNGAMRFGISLNLWTKQEWEDLDHNPAPSNPRPTAPASAPEQAPKQSKPKTLTPLSQAQIDQFNTACEAKGITPLAVALNAGIPEGTPWMESHLPALRSAFKELASFKDGE
jgi:hypothetical protein